MSWGLQKEARDPRRIGWDWTGVERVTWGLMGLLWGDEQEDEQSHEAPLEDLEVGDFALVN